MADAAAALAANRTAKWSRPTSQAPMVEVFGPDFLPLADRWNRLLRTKAAAPPSDLRGAVADASAAHADCLWHFTGTPKPWEAAAADHWTAALWRRAARPACAAAGLLAP